MKVKQLLQFLQDNPDLHDHNIEIQQLVLEQGRNPIPYFLKSVDDILKILGIPVLNVDQLQENQENGNLIIRVPYHLTPKIENYLNTMFED